MSSRPFTSIAGAFSAEPARLGRSVVARLYSGLETRDGGGGGGGRMDDRGARAQSSPPGWWRLSAPLRHNSHREPVGLACSALRFANALKEKKKKAAISHSSLFFFDRLHLCDPARPSPVETRKPHPLTQARLFEANYRLVALTRDKKGTFWRHLISMLDDLSSASSQECV